MGSIQRLSKGKYKLTAEFGYDVEGKRIRKHRTVEASGPRAAKEMLAKFEEELLENDKMDVTNLRFVDYVELWRKNYADSQLEPSTREIYEIMLNTIIPHFQRKKLADVHDFHLTHYLNGEKLNGRGSLEKKYNVLKSLFKYAVIWKLLPRDPMDGVGKPKVVADEMQFYDREELEILMKLIEELDTRHQLMIKLTVAGGLRRGELLGIAYDCVDFAKNQIFIKRSLQYTKKEGFRLKETKTGESRIITFPSTVMDELRIYYKKQLYARTNNEREWEGFVDVRGREVMLFVCDAAGHPYNPQAVTRFWGRFMRRNMDVIKRIRFQDLRHSSASLILSDGINMKVLQKRLGHKDIKTSLNIYSHVTNKDDQKASDVFNDLV